MRTPVIVEALRTPIGRARKGSLVTKDAFELARVVVGAVLDRTKIAPTPIDAIPKALARAGVEQGDVDLFEINEAFCAVPVAATGARMVVSMVHELRRRGARLGCVSMCAGGGMGMAMVIETL
jgi:acetyl-CoA acetyltransferase